MYSPCLSAIGGGQPLSSPMRHSLGKPLPYQLADAVQASQKVSCDFTPKVLIKGDYRELPTLSSSYARLFGEYLYITTSSATGLAARSTCMPYPRRQHSS